MKKWAEKLKNRGVFMQFWSPGMSLEDAEKAIIVHAVSFYGCEEKAANSLKISIKEIKKKTARYLEDIEKMKEKRAKEKIAHEDFMRRSRGLPAL